MSKDREFTFQFIIRKLMIETQKKDRRLQAPRASQDVQYLGLN